MAELVHIASSFERDSLERLEKFLTHHQIKCHIEVDPYQNTRHHLLIEKEDMQQAQRILEEITYSNIDSGKMEDLVEIGFDGVERNEVASWLQILLDEEDHEGSPIFFYKPQYEAVLDALHAEGKVDIPCFILRGLKNYIPEGQKRFVMGSGLQEFFNLIESVAAEE